MASTAPSTTTAAAAAAAAAAATTAARGTPERIIIDTDPGVDDTMAILLAMAAPETVTVEALTITMGNHKDVDLLARNACMCAQIAGLSSKVKVVKGARKPLQRQYDGETGIAIHGDNGIGNVELPFKVDMTPVESHSHVSAAAYLVEACAAAPGEITLVTLGPLTNIAAACLLNPTFPKTVKRLVMMGGATHGAGNKSPIGEANIHNDPEAAKIVYGSFPDITMAGLRVTHQVGLNTLRERLRKEAGPVGQFMFDISEHYCKFLQGWGHPKQSVHDASAVMFVLHPELYTSKRACVDVETKGELTAGATVADWMGHWNREPNTTILMTVDEAGFHDRFVGYVQRYTAKEGVAQLFKAKDKKAKATKK